MKKSIYVFATLILVVLIYGCGTIMHGTSQDVGLSSNPSNAKVTIDGIPSGNTPVIVSLSRKDNHSVMIELEGFYPYSNTLTGSVTGWVWGNILFGGLIGLAVDAISGGLYVLNPEQVAAELKKNDEICIVELKNNQLYITVVFQSKPEWEKIGQLEKLN